VGHEGGNPRGQFCLTLTAADIATGWTENQSVRNRAQVHVFAALRHVVENLPFPIRGESLVSSTPRLQRCSGPTQTRSSSPSGSDPAATRCGWTNTTAAPAGRTAT
jgi:hypothetical protein